MICGLDSVPARRWINSTLVSLLAHDDDGNVDLDTVVPYIDAGTEGFKGHTRVIFPGVTSCLEVRLMDERELALLIFILFFFFFFFSAFQCTIELFPPTEKVPLCTVAATPRNAAHCIQYEKERKEKLDLICL